MLGVSVIVLAILLSSFSKHVSPGDCGHLYLVWSGPSSQEAGACTKAWGRWGFWRIQGSGDKGLEISNFCCLALSPPLRTPGSYFPRKPFLSFLPPCPFLPSSLLSSFLGTSSFARCALAVMIRSSLEAGGRDRFCHK